MMLIESPSNPFIKEAATLHQRKHRDAKGVVLVEGLHPLEEAARAGLAIYQLFLLQEDLPRPPLPDTIQIQVSERVMAKLATTDSPPPCVATVERPPVRAVSDIEAPAPLLLVLDQIQDPGNLGTLLRSARAFGVDAAVLTAGSVDPYNPKVIRGSAGLVFSLPIVQSQASLPGLLDELAAASYRIYATSGSPDQAVSYRNVDYGGPCAIVLGNEGTGLPGGLAARGLQWITIPMSAGTESLNVGVSGSIILAEAAAQRAPQNLELQQKQQA